MECVEVPTLVWGVTESHTPDFFMINVVFATEQILVWVVITFHGQLLPLMDVRFVRVITLAMDVMENRIPRTTMTFVELVRTEHNN